MLTKYFRLGGMYWVKKLKNREKMKEKEERDAAKTNVKIKETPMVIATHPKLRLYTAIMVLTWWVLDSRSLSLIHQILPV